MSDNLVFCPTCGYPGTPEEVAAHIADYENAAEDDYPRDYGGAFDGFQVISDADPGL